jgi:hypothetical protein
MFPLLSKGPDAPALGFLIFYYSQFVCRQLPWLQKLDPKTDLFFQPPKHLCRQPTQKPKTELIVLAKLRQKKSHEGFNNNFEMMLSPQETR